MSVLGDKSRYIKQLDPLVAQGGIITLGMQNRSDHTDDGIFWSLPLAHLHYYGDPIVATGRTGLRESHVTFDQFPCVILGAVLGSWGWKEADISIPLKVILMLDSARIPNMLPTPIPEWLQLLRKTVEDFDLSEDLEKDQRSRLIAFGRRKCTHMLCPRSKWPAPVFGLTDFKMLLRSFEGRNGSTMDKMLTILPEKIDFLRRWAVINSSECYLEGAIICYLEEGANTLKFTDLLQRTIGNRRKGTEELEPIGIYLTWQTRIRSESPTRPDNILEDRGKTNSRQGRQPGLAAGRCKIMLTVFRL